MTAIMRPFAKPNKGQKVGTFCQIGTDSQGLKPADRTGRCRLDASLARSILILWFL